MLLQHLQRGIKEKTEEDIALTKEITCLLSKLDLESEVVLPNDIKEGLEKLSLALRAENLLEFDEIALRVAGERKIVEEKRQQYEEKQMSRMYDKLFSNYANLQTKLNHVQDAVDSLKDTVDNYERDKDDLHCSKAFLATKLNKYQETVEKLETELNDMQINELYPENILKKYRLYLEETGRLTDLNQSLHQYGDLPPNLLQAKILLENKRKEYEYVEQLFLEKIN